MRNLSTSIRNFKEHPIEKTLSVDMHCHILPALDDGSENMEVSVNLAKGLVAKGFEKVIVTPHIMYGFYNNDEHTIKAKVKILETKLKDNNIPLELDYAAEYYLDDHFIQSIEAHNTPITIGRNSNFVLLETSFVESFDRLTKTVEQLRYIGFRPVLAHPERYIYLDPNNGRYEKLQNLGVLFQVNINSLIGYYSKSSQQKAEYLIEHDMVSFLGTNCHNQVQLESLDFAYDSKHFQLAMTSSRLLNEIL